MYFKLTSISFCRSIFFTVLLLSLSLSAFAESGLITNGFTSSYESFGDGDRVVHITDETSGFQRGLFIKEVRSDVEIKLSGELGSLGDVSKFQVSPDKSRIVYIGARSDGGVKELYSVPSVGGTSIKLSVVLAIGAGDSLGSYKITPNSNHVVYTVLRAGIFVSLYIVPIDGGASTQLGVESEFVGIGQITNDSKYLIFIGSDLDPVYSGNVYRVDLSDGSVVKLSDDLTGDGFLDFPVLTADSKSVIYDSYSTATEEQGLFASSIVNGNSIKLTSTQSVGVDKFIGINDLLIYYIGQNMDGKNRLFGVPLVGGDAIEIVSNLATDKSIDTNGPFKMSSNGLHAIFTVGNFAANELYSANLITGIATKLNSSGRVIGFEITDDGGYVVFNADSETVNLIELFATPIGGGTAIKLSMNYSNTSNTTSGINYDISRDGKRVAYWIDIDGDFNHEIFEVAITGGVSKRLSPELPSEVLGGVALGFPEYSMDGSLVLFSISEFEGVNRGIYAFDFDPLVEEFCFPVLAANDKVAIICL